MDRTEFEEKVLTKCKTQGLVISRIPKSTREEFVKFAEEYYADDYGLCFKWCFDQSLEYNQMKIMFFDNLNNKIDYLISKLDIPKQEEKKPTKEIRFLDGKTRRIEKEVQDG